MNRQRILAVILRHLYVWPRGIERFMSSVGWPLVSLFTWGLTASYLEKSSISSVSITTLILGGIIFWSITSRSQLETTISFMDEVWNKNLINMFSTPLSLSEFLIAVILLDILKLIITLVFLIIFAYAFYSFNVMIFSWYIPFFLINLTIFGWMFGFLVIGLIIRFGRNIEEFTWSLLAFVSPFSCVYYPLSSLPLWAQKIALLLPSTYIFEEMRRFMTENQVIWGNIGISFVLNIIYLILSLIFLHLMFEKARETGRLAKLEE